MMQGQNLRQNVHSAVRWPNGLVSLAAFFSAAALLCCSTRVRSADKRAASSAALVLASSSCLISCVSVAPSRCVSIPRQQTPSTPPRESPVFALLSSSSFWRAPHAPPPPSPFSPLRRVHCTRLSLVRAALRPARSPRFSFPRQALRARAQTCALSCARAAILRVRAAVATWPGCCRSRSILMRALACWWVQLFNARARQPLLNA
jgi:hypothetical protein